jgi:hypothetical protein
MLLGASSDSEQWVCPSSQRDEQLLTDTGYPMAKNLRAKIPKSDTLTIFDVNSSSVDKLVKEAAPANVKVAKGPREVAENAVCPLPTSSSSMMSSYCSIYDLSSRSSDPLRDSSSSKPIL